MLYNNFVEQRKTGWEKNKKGFTLYEQLNRLPKLKKTYPKLRTVYSQVLQNVGIRVELAYQAFFRRFRKHETPGYPRFKGYGRYDSFCYPSCVSVEVGEDYVYLPKIGKLDAVIHRKIEGKLKTATVKRLHRKWYLFLVTDHVNKRDLPKSDKSVGIDVGITTFATLSDGNRIENPRFFEAKQRALTKAQRRFQKAKSGKCGVRVAKTKKVVSRIHEKIGNSRHNFIHQTTNRLIRDYGILSLEDINTNSLLKKRWCNKQILDAAWANFASVLEVKAECAGRQVVKVNPAYTSQSCSKCGTRTLHKLEDRVFRCSCGHSEDRDANASKNILALGLQSLLAKAS